MEERQYPCVGELVTLSSPSIQSMEQKKMRVGGGERIKRKVHTGGSWKREGGVVSHDRTLARLINTQEEGINCFSPARFHLPGVDERKGSAHPGGWKGDFKTMKRTLSKFTVCKT